MTPLDMLGFSIYNSDSLLLFRLSIVAHPDITESNKSTKHRNFTSRKQSETRRNS
jgi:hypothetical protein